MEEYRYNLDIAVGKLETTDYQREVIKNHSLQSDKFDVGGAGTLYVIEIAGKYYIGDGLQRVTACKEQLGPDFELPCRVYRNCTKKREIELFTMWNKKRRNVNPLHIFRNEVLNCEPNSCAIMKIVEEAGFTIGPGPNKIHNFTGVKFLEQIYNAKAANKRPEVLEAVLRVMMGAFGGTTLATYSQICQTVDPLIRRYEIDEDVLIKYLDNYDSKDDLVKLDRKIGTNGKAGQEGKRAAYIANELGFKLKDNPGYNKEKRNTRETSIHVAITEK